MTTNIAVPHVELERSVLLLQPGVSVAPTTSPNSLAARHWPLGRPTALRLEIALDTVEDAIEQAGLRQADRTVLCAAHQPARAVAATLARVRGVHP